MSAATAPILAVVGATGTGKSALGIALAHEMQSRGRGAEIIGADAMQLYRGMDIGTAKLPEAQREGIAHHLLDIAEPNEVVTVADYQPLARGAATDIIAREATPILVGGSGLYVNAALYDFNFPPQNEAVRVRLTEEYETRGLDPLVQRLLESDPAAREAFDLANPRRVIRALEVIEITGRPMTSQLPEAPVPARPTTVIGVHEEREVLVQRLDARVEQMWQDGMVREVETLLERGLQDGATARQAIGYAQAIAQIDGTLSEAEAIAETQRLTRRYARRQVSWFKRLPGITWVSSSESQDPAQITRIVDEFLAFHGSQHAPKHSP